MSSGKSPKKKSRKGTKGKSSSGLLTIGIVAVVLLGLGTGAWLAIPRLFPRGIPGLSLQARHESSLKAVHAAQLARLEVEGTLIDAASAKAGLPSLKRAMENEIAALDACARLFQDSPPAEPDHPVLFELWKIEAEQTMNIKNKWETVRINLPDGTRQAIARELKELSEPDSIFDRSQPGYDPNEHMTLRDRLQKSLDNYIRATEVIFPKTQITTQAPVASPTNP